MGSGSHKKKTKSEDESTSSSQTISNEGASSSRTTKKIITKENEMEIERLKEKKEKKKTKEKKVNSKKEEIKNTRYEEDTKTIKTNHKGSYESEKSTCTVTDDEFYHETSLKKKKKKKEKKMTRENSELDEESPKRKKKRKHEEDEEKSRKKKRKKERKEKSANESPNEINKEGISLLLFYAYVEPEWNEKEFNNAMKFAQLKAESFHITGRLRVAREGFNGTLTGSYDNIRAFCDALKEWNSVLFGEDHNLKLTDNLPQGQAFPELKVMPVTELVNYGLHGKQPSIKDHGGIHLNAKEYHEKMKEPNTVIIDVRNSYEAQIGRFQPPEGGAVYIDPKMRVSTEFPQWVEKNKDSLKDKQVMMYCTGGIRCERASALLKSTGFEQPVYQIKGGIDNYLKEFKQDGGYWTGKNYTFDKRFAHGADNAETIGKCSRCKQPWDKFRGKKRCKACGVPLLICNECQEKKLHESTHCELCQEQGVDTRHKLPENFIQNKGGNNRKAKANVQVLKCGVCGEEFKSRNAMFRHIKDLGHFNRTRQKRQMRS